MGLPSLFSSSLNYNACTSATTRCAPADCRLNDLCPWYQGRGRSTNPTSCRDATSGNHHSDGIRKTGRSSSLSKVVVSIPVTIPPVIFAQIVVELAPVSPRLSLNSSSDRCISALSRAISSGLAPDRLSCVSSRLAQPRGRTTLQLSFLSVFLPNECFPGPYSTTFPSQNQGRGRMRRRSTQDRPQYFALGERT